MEIEFVTYKLIKIKFIRIKLRDRKNGIIYR